MSSSEPQNPESIKQAKIEARSIIERLDPEHIEGWGHLIILLEDCIKNAKRYVNIQGKIIKKSN